MFFIKIAMCVLWFGLVAAEMLILGLIRFRDPSLAHIWASSFSRGVEKILGVRVDIRNAHLLRAPPPFIIVGNHQSAVDIFVHARCVPPRTVGIGKRELIWMPIFGQIFYLTGNLFINRKNKMKARSTLQDAIEGMLQKKLNIYMFPEGTRNRSARQLLPFKKGAFAMAIEAKVPILPVVAQRFDSWSDIVRSGVVRVDVLQPISTVGLKEGDTPKLMEQCFSVMQATYQGISKVKEPK